MKSARTSRVLQILTTFQSRTFKLNSIKTLEALNQCFADGRDFDIHEYLGRAWLIKPEGQLYNIKLRFLPQVAEDVAQVQWHSKLVPMVWTETPSSQGGTVLHGYRLTGSGGGSP